MHVFLVGAFDAAEPALVVADSGQREGLSRSNDGLGPLCCVPTTATDASRSCFVSLTGRSQQGLKRLGVHTEWSPAAGATDDWVCPGIVFVTSNAARCSKPPACRSSSIHGDKRLLGDCLVSATQPTESAVADTWTTVISPARCSADTRLCFHGTAMPWWMAQRDRR